MDEKTPLLRPLVRADSGRLRWEVFLSAIVVSIFIVLGAVIQRSPNPRQSPMALPALAQYDQQFSWANITPSRTLQWHPCFDTESDCARLDVPMDWLDPSDDQRVILAIARLRATETEHHQGSVFFNPGGPGGSGVWALRDHGKHIQTVVGRNHDIITFDPRGISASIPRIECWGSAQRRHNWAMQETPVIDSHPGVFFDVFARATAFSKACERMHGDTGFLQHVSTASHARDMLEILDQLGEEKLQYWGFSYGTVLGGTFAAMYPDKVGRLVSDGNVDYNEWYNAAHINAVRDADKVMDAFYELCHKAGPLNCAFHGGSPETMKERHNAVLEKLRENPIIYVPDSELGSELPELITYSKIRKLAGTSLYRPNYYFKYLAEILAGLEREDGRPYYDFVTRFGSPFADFCTAEQIPPTEPLSEGEGTDDAFPTIMCADGVPIAESAKEFAEHVAEMEDISHATGAIVLKDRIACAGRRIRPKWRFDGEQRRTGALRHG